MTSVRLPGKVLMRAGGVPLLQVLIDRLRRARTVDSIVVATTSRPTDQPIVRLARRLGVGAFLGDEHDVLGRVSGALHASEAAVCVEITGDCPLVDPVIVDEAVAAYLETSAQHPYVSNSDPHRAVPAGLDVQVFSAYALHQLATEADDPLEREHVSYGFYRPDAGERWRPRFITHDSTRGAEDLLVTLDYAEDYELIRSLHEDLSRTDTLYHAPTIIRWIREHPALQQRCRVVRGLA